MLVSVSPIKVLVVAKKGWAYPSHNAHLRSPCYQPPAPPPLQIVVCDRIVPGLRPDLDDVDHNGKEPPLLKSLTCDSAGISGRITRTVWQAVRVCRMRKSNGCLGFFVLRSATLTSSASPHCSAGICNEPRVPPVLQDDKFVVCQEGLQSFAARCLGERVWSIVRVDTGKDFEWGRYCL